jgi:uridine kinase
MIKSEQIAKKINKQIDVWKKDHAKLVVAIDGYAGSGKTTIGNFIEKHNEDVLVIHIDDFINHIKIRRKLINKAKDKSKIFEYHWYRYNDLEKLTESFLKNKKKINLKTYNYDKNDFNPKQLFYLSKNILLIEGIFLFHPKHKISKLINKKIYLDSNFLKADRARVLREKKKYGKNYLPENHPNNWTKYFKESYERYIKQYNIKKKIDLLIKI